MAHKSPVTPELRRAVLSRDRGCVAAAIDYEHHPICRDQWGTAHSSGDVERMQLDHVHDGYGKAGKRAPSDMQHLVTLCAHAHLNGWATSHRTELRAYLRQFEQSA